MRWREHQKSGKNPNFIPNLYSKLYSKLYAKRKNVKTVFYAYQQTSIEPEPLRSKVERVIEPLTLRTSSGVDEIIAEQLQNAGENEEIFYHKLIARIWCKKLG